MPGLSKRLQIPKIEQNKTIPLFSDGEYSMHDLLESILDITDSASVSIASFSVTETALRRLHRLMEEGKINSLRCLFDYNVKRFTLELLFFASNITSEIGLDKNHSKIILISNENWNISVIGSANFNVNDKKEACILSTEAHIFEATKSVYEEWFAHSLKVTEHEFK
jgi:hypothetical protein